MKSPISFHRRISTDLTEILDHYEQGADSKLADDFHEELMSRLEIVRRNPNFFPYYRDTIRRANLKRFPYHFLYEIRPTTIWVFVLRHDSRQPSYGIRRR